MDAMVSEANNLLIERFGTTASWTIFAPGRVNLIGEHTDYNDGFVFPAAIDRGVTLSFALTDGPSELYSSHSGAGEPFDANTVEPGQVSGWARYPAGVAWALRNQGRLPNLKGAVVSNLPMGCGLSSSAAIELAFGVAWNVAAGLGLSSRELALIGQTAENDFVGMNCGVMDQMASALGKKDHAIFLDTRSLDALYSPVPEGVSLVICDTGKKRELTASAYNERRGQCERACQILGVDSLREAKIADVEASADRLGDVLFRRAMHVVTENERCLSMHEALVKGDLDRVGSLMAASHFSLRNNYEVSCIELDSMVENVVGVIGCIGARMTGAGFGGACLALVRSQDLPAFVRTAAANYSQAMGTQGHTFIECQAEDGARIVGRDAQAGQFSENSGQTISRMTKDVE